MYAEKEQETRIQCMQERFIKNKEKVRTQLAWKQTKQYARKVGNN